MTLYIIDPKEQCGLASTSAVSGAQVPVSGTCSEFHTINTNKVHVEKSNAKQRMDETICGGKNPNTGRIRIPW